MVVVDQERTRTTVQARGWSIARPNPRELLQKRNRPLLILVVAALLLTLTIILPYWHITLYAPQYPKGLSVDAYVNRLSGDVREVDGLNHYIGMMKLDEAAKLERTVSRIAIPLVAVLTIAAFWIPGRWKWLAIVPILIFPFVFLTDLFVWLYYAGHSLDPHAALSSSIKPFTPKVLGAGRIGQFRTDASLGIGYLLAVLAAALAVIAIVMERRRERAAR